MSYLLDELDAYVNYQLTRYIAATELAAWLRDARTIRISYVSERRNIAARYNSLLTTRPRTAAVVVNLDIEPWRSRDMAFRALFDLRTSTTNPSSEAGAGTKHSVPDNIALAWRMALVDSATALREYRRLTVVRTDGEEVTTPDALTDRTLVSQFLDGQISARMLMAGVPRLAMAGSEAMERVSRQFQQELPDRKAPEGGRDGQPEGESQ